MPFAPSTADSDRGCYRKCCALSNIHRSAPMWTYAKDISPRPWVVVSPTLYKRLLRCCLSAVLFPPGNFRLRRAALSEQATAGMKAGFFRTLIEDCGDNQIIIMENELPEGVDYSGVHLVPFGEDGGREGFYE